MFKLLSLGNNRDQPKSSPKKSKEKINNDSEVTNCWFWRLQTTIFRLLPVSKPLTVRFKRIKASKLKIVGSIHDDPVVRAARAGRTVEEILAEDRNSSARPKFDTTNVNSEYGFRYQNMKLDKASPRTPGEYYPQGLPGHGLNTLK